MTLPKKILAALLTGQFVLTLAAVPASAAEKTWCFGTGSGGTGGSCTAFDSEQKCKDTVCKQSEAVVDPNCDPNTETCGVVSGSTCGCSCYKDLAACQKATGTGFKEVSPLKNPLGTENIRTIVARGIKLFTGISGSLALLMFIYGGFLWVTSGGNMEKVKQGQKAVVNAALGLVIIFTAYVAIAAIFKAFAGIAI